MEQWYSKLRYRVIIKDQPRKKDLFFQQLAVEKKLTSYSARVPYSCDSTFVSRSRVCESSEREISKQSKLKSLIGKKLASRTQNYAFELFIDNVNRDAHHAKQRVSHETPDNLLPQCRKAHKQLKNIYDDEEIIIKPFDKGTGFFFLHKDDYIQHFIIK